MHYNALRQLARIEKSNLLANSIIVKALESDRGDIIRAMNVADLKMMKESVTCAVSNKLAVDAQLAHEYECVKYARELDGIASDPTAEFKPRSDVEIEKEVSAFFEIDGKLHYRDVKLESISTLLGFDKFVKCATQQMKNGERGMRYNPYRLADRLERADILTNIDIMFALRDERGESGDVIRAMSYAEFKRRRKDIFSFYYRTLYANAAHNFEQACDEYDAERDGIENDPRKTFRPKNDFEIDQDLRAYFEEQRTLH